MNLVLGDNFQQAGENFIFDACVSDKYIATILIISLEEVCRILILKDSTSKG